MRFRIDQTRVVSEELSSVEILLGIYGSEFNREFQKNLVVWKWIAYIHCTETTKLFQKNLVVWKRNGGKEKSKIYRKVSEELSSVETDILRLVWSRSGKTFQKNLVVWKRMPHFPFY